MIVRFQRSLEHRKRHRLIVHYEHHRSRRADCGRGHTPSGLEMTALSSGMYLHTAEAKEKPEEAYCGWTLRDRLEVLAFDARLSIPKPRG